VNEKKLFNLTFAVNDLYDKPTQSSVIQIIQHNVRLKVFLFHLPKCLSVMIVIYVYFTHMSQNSVQTHLRCSGTYNNGMIANCLQSPPKKKFENRSIIGEDTYKSKVARFYWPTLYMLYTCSSRRLNYRTVSERLKRL